MTVERHFAGLAVLDHGGDGPDVLLLHGAHRTALDREPVRHRLPGLRPAAMDLRGHGHPAPASAYEWTAMPADVDTVVHGLGLRRRWLVGHSLGGVLAVRYAASRDCAGVVDLDGFGGGGPELHPGLTPEEVRARRADQTAPYATAPATTDPDALEARARAAAGRFGWDPDHQAARARRSEGSPDSETGEIHVDHQIQRAGRRIPHRETKTEESHAFLPVPALCLKALRVRRAQQTGDRRAAGELWQGSHDLSITTKYGTAIEPGHLTRCSTCGLAAPVSASSRSGTPGTRAARSWSR